MKKKIVFRSGTLRMGGLERVLVEVLQNIDKEKYDINLFIEDDSGDENIFIKDIPEGIKLYFLKSEKLVKRVEDYRKKKQNIWYKLLYNYMMEKERRVVFKNTMRYLKEIGEVDLFIDFDWGATRYVEKFPVKKSVVWMHNSIPKLLGGRERKIERFGKRLAKYDKVVAICDDMKEEIEKIYPYLKGKVERIYNPFNFKRIEDLSTEDLQLDKEHKKLLEQRYCLAVSRLDTVQKDYETLIKAFSLLKKRGESLKLFIVGDGAGRGEIEKLIENYDLKDRIKLLGLQKNPYIWMKNAEFFVHSSKYEGLPTVLIEAMILDKAIISSDCPTGPREILENGKSGILYPVGDYNALEKAILKIENSSDEKDKILKNSQMRKQDFESKRVIKEYEKLIDRI